MGKDYPVCRKTKTISKYGLRRRTEAVIQQFQQFNFPSPCIFLDVGTANGLILRSLTEYYGSNNSIGIGIDTNFRYLKSAKKT